MMKTQKLNKKDLRLSLEKERNDWNERIPLGSRVVIRPAIESLDPRETRTRSQAWIVSGHTVMVMVEGAPGVVPLSAIISAEPRVRRSA